MKCLKHILLIFIGLGINTYLRAAELSSVMRRIEDTLVESINRNIKQLVSTIGDIIPGEKEIFVHESTKLTDLIKQRGQPSDASTVLLSIKIKNDHFKNGKTIAVLPYGPKFSFIDDIGKMHISPYMKIKDDVEIMNTPTSPLIGVPLDNNIHIKSALEDFFERSIKPLFYGFTIKQEALKSIRRSEKISKKKKLWHSKKIEKEST